MPDILVTPGAPSSAITGLQEGCLTCGTNICPKGFVNFPSTAANDAKVVCVDCFLDMARQVGCLNPDQAQDARQRLGDAQTTITQLQAELDEAHVKAGLLDALNELRFSASGSTTR